MSEPRDPHREIELVTEPVKPAGRRLFVGIRVSIATANSLVGAVETLARRARDAGADIRWGAPANYHVTLKYLGWTREAAIGVLYDALAEAVRGTQRFTFRTTRLGAFPSLDKASVVWAGVEDGGALAALAKRIETAATALGFRPEERPFHPHVTLGRSREIRAVREVVLPMSEQMFSDTRVDAVQLFESETKSSGSVYKEIFGIGFNQAQTPSFDASERQTKALDLGAPNQSSDTDHAETDDGWPRGQGPTG